MLSAYTCTDVVFQVQSWNDWERSDARDTSVGRGRSRGRGGRSGAAPKGGRSAPRGGAVPGKGAGGATEQVGGAEAAATSASQGGSRWRPRKTSAEKKADNKRKRQQSGSLARNAVTAKFIRKLEAKDTLIGQLQAGSKSTGPRRILHSLRPGRRSRVQR